MVLCGMSYLLDMDEHHSHTYNFDTSAKRQGRIIKWTYHTGFLTLAGMDPIAEGNHGNDSKEE